MLISTKGRYAIRVMLDIAENSNGNFVAMKDIAKRQEVSIKYMTKIMPTLTENGLVEAVKGKGGGYRLKREASDYTLKEIIELTDGSYAPVSCLDKGKDENTCVRKKTCKTLPMWSEVYELLDGYFSKKKLTDLL